MPYGTDGARTILGGSLGRTFVACTKQMPRSHRRSKRRSTKIVKRRSTKIVKRRSVRSARSKRAIRGGDVGNNYWKSRETDSSKRDYKRLDGMHFNGEKFVESPGGHVDLRHVRDGVNGVVYSILVNQPGDIEAANPRHPRGRYDRVKAEFESLFRSQQYKKNPPRAVPPSEWTGWPMATY